jgi:hypothetical protein
LRHEGGLRRLQQLDEGANFIRTGKAFNLDIRTFDVKPGLFGQTSKFVVIHEWYRLT